MAETSFPVAGGAGVTDAAYERLLGPITGAGRYDFGVTNSAYTTSLIYGDSSGRQVKALANQSAMVRGFRWESGSTPPSISLDANTSGNTRLDLIVLRLNRSTFTVRLGKTNGTPSTLPAAPAPVQDSGSAGVWELPLATVRVTSSGTSGQPTIAATDVTPVDYWVTPPSYVVRNGGNLPAPTSGALLTRLDNGRTYLGNGAGYTLLGEAGVLTKITAAGGWTNDYIYCQRINGMTYFQCTLTLNISSRAPNTDVTICTLPTDFRPQQDIYAVAGMAPGQVGYCLFTASDGTVKIITYPQTYPNGGSLIVHPFAYPSK